MGSFIDDLKSALLFEVIQGNTAAVCSLLQKGVDVNATDLEGNSSLHVAAGNDSFEILCVLLKNGANMEATNFIGWTPLMQASRFGHEKSVSILLKHGASVTRNNRFGLTALMLACASGQLDVVRLLLEKEMAWLDNMKSSSSQVSPLAIAALYGNLDVMRLFLDKGINTNTSHLYGDITPLMIASASGNLKGVKMLIERGAKVDSINAGGFSALDAASVWNNREIVDHLKRYFLSEKKEENKSPDIMEVSSMGNVSLLKNILQDDPSKAKMVTGEGATPLMIASMANHLPIAQILLQYGADINAQDYLNGWTALMQAVFHRHTPMVIFLLRSGADINISTPQGYNAFDLANVILDVDILKVFFNFSETRLTPFSSALDNTFKKENVVSPTLSSIKQFCSKFFKRRNSTSDENISKRRNSFPSSTLTYEPIYPDSDADENEDNMYTNVFSVLKTKQAKFMQGLAVPVPENKTRKEVPLGGSTKKTMVRFPSNSILIKRNKDRPEYAESCKFVHRRGDHPPIPSIVISDSTTKSPLGAPKLSDLYSVEEGCKSKHHCDCQSASSFHQMRKLLQDLDMKSFVEIFREEQVDLEALKILLTEDFSELGIQEKSEVNRIRRAAQETKPKDHNCSSDFCYH